MEIKEAVIVQYDVDILIEPNYNPRKISAKQREEIKKSLTEFGFVTPLVVNINEDRKNIVVGGNQRLKIAKSIGFTTVPCVEVNLSEDREKELNIRLNKNTAEFDYELLKKYFEKDLLFEIGFTESELGKTLSDYEEKLAEFDNDNCEMPIVQKFNEKYDSVIIFSNNEMDFNWLRNVLDLKRKKDYKNTKIGESLVITVQEFQKIWEEATNEETNEATN